MSQTVNKYLVYCTDAGGRWEEVWSTTTPTVCPSDGTPIDPTATVIEESVSSNDVTVENFPLTAFGELKTAELTPIVQLLFSYGIPSQTVSTSVTGSGSVTATGGLVSASTGAAINSSAALYSNQAIVYKAGQGTTIRFTAVFTPGVAGNEQRAGAFDDYDGVGFGYDGADFGVFHCKNTVTTWIPQTSWNVDPLDGTGPSGANINFDDGYGNVFQVQFQYLGFGGISYGVENPQTGKFVLVHLIKYSNANTTPSFMVPSFPLRISSTNTTNNTDIIVQTASMMGALEGKLVFKGPQFNDSWISSAVASGTETFIRAWRVKTTFNGIANKTVVYATLLSMATGTADKPQILRLRMNATFTGATWTDISTGNSVVEYLSAGTWNNDGNIMALIVVPGKGDPYINEITPSPESLQGGPGVNLVVTLEGIGGAGTSTGSLSWLEDL